MRRRELWRRVAKTYIYAAALAAAVRYILRLPPRVWGHCGGTLRVL